MNEDRVKQIIQKDREDRGPGCATALLVMILLWLAVPIGGLLAIEIYGAVLCATGWIGKANCINLAKEAIIVNPDVYAERRSSQTSPQGASSP